MDAFYKSMALAWTLAEGLILIFLSGGLTSLKRDKATQKTFLVFCVTVFALLVCVVSFGEGLFGRFMPLQRGRNLILYRWALWNLFCTLWVIIEGVIVLYVFRIYRMLKPPEQDRGGRTGHGSIRGINAVYPMALLIVTALGFYGLYEYSLLCLTHEKGLRAQDIYALSVFYIKICGLFWILFEWVVALLGLKAYRILKKREDII